MNVGKGQQREWCELQAHAAAALGKTPQALEAAMNRAQQDRGYEVAGRRLLADCHFAAGNFHDALTAYMVCTEAQLANYSTWERIAVCYLRLAESQSLPDRLESPQLVCNFAGQSYLRAYAWAYHARKNSYGFASETHAQREQSFYNALIGLYPATQGKPTHQMRQVFEEEISALGKLYRYRLLSQRGFISVTLPMLGNSL
eukprot:m.83703 g.83703  ORF g.83703 m.83703 type:complete len:201 (-) comp12726_c0_seq7:41-643(-)